MRELQSSLPLCSLLYLREFLCNALDEIPRYMLLNLRCNSLISSDSQRLTEIVFLQQLQTLHEILSRLLVRFLYTNGCRRRTIQFNDEVV